MGNMIEHAIEMAIQALNSMDEDKAAMAIAYDEEINGEEKEIENLCFKLLLQQQPVARDLRFISSALKMITDMERIGDQAADIAEITPERVRRTFEVNVYAPLFMAQAAVPLLPPGASVIITASAEYYTPNKLLLDYAASKSAVTAFGVALSKYLLDKGVRVNSVCPGPTWTPLEVSGGNPDEDIPRHGADTPLERAAQPAEMAGIYVFLASSEASYITGEIYGITGGLSGK